MDERPSTLAEGRYVIERQLGEGGMGSVFLARDTNLGGRPVALKVLTTAEGAYLSRFRREARLMARLRHPGLIEVYDVRLDGPEPYIAQEYVEGSDLAVFLAGSGPLSLSSSHRLARELAETLAYLHGQGVVHRDLKPGNVMLGRDGRSRLADLGLAVGGDSTRLTQEGVVLGTVLYMAPEAARGEPLGPPADLFAWGLVIWEAATGHHPFEGAATPQAHLAKLLTSNLALPEPPPGLAPELARVLARCLSLRPGDRPADGAEVVKLLDRATGAAASSPTPSRPPTHAPPPSLSPRTSRRPAAIALAVLLLVLAGALAIRTGPTEPEGAAAAHAAGPSPPAVTCHFDAIGLSLADPPLEGMVARLETLDGRLLVERPMRTSRMLLRPGEGAGPVRWVVRTPRGTFEGVAAAGPRLLFDAATHRPGTEVDASLGGGPPLVVGGRLVVPCAPSSLFVLRPVRRPGEPLSLDLQTERRTPPRPFALAPRGGHGAAALLPLPPGHVLALLFGRPGAVLTVPLDPNEEASLAETPGQEALDALAAPVPGGGCLFAADVLQGEAGSPGRSVTLGVVDGPPPTPPRWTLVLPGRTPLALAPLDGDRALVAYESGHGAVAAVVGTTAGGGPAVLTSLSLGVPSPLLRDLDKPSAVSLTRGGAALTVGGRLVVASPRGRLRVVDLGLGERDGVVKLWPTLDGGLAAFVARLPTPSIPTWVNLGLQPVPASDDGAPLPPAVPVGFIAEHIRDLRPMGALALPDGGALVYCRGLLAETGRQPGFERRRTLTMDNERGRLVEIDGAVFLVTTKGRVYGMDLERP